MSGFDTPKKPVVGLRSGPRARAALERSYRARDEAAARAAAEGEAPRRTAPAEGGERGPRKWEERPPRASEPRRDDRAPAGRERPATHGERASAPRADWNRSPGRPPRDGDSGSRDGRGGDRPRREEGFNKPRDGGFQSRDGGFKPRGEGFAPRSPDERPADGRAAGPRGGERSSQERRSGPREERRPDREAGFRPREEGFRPRGENTPQRDERPRFTEDRSRAREGAASRGEPPRSNPDRSRNRDEAPRAWGDRERPSGNGPRRDPGAAGNPRNAGFGNRDERPARSGESQSERPRFDRDGRGERPRPPYASGERAAPAGESPRRRSEEWAAREGAGERPLRRPDDARARGGESAPRSLRGNESERPVSDRPHGDRRSVGGWATDASRPRRDADAAAPRAPRTAGGFAAPKRRVEVDPSAGVRISKLMAERGLCSRREADEYIERGWVFVNGQPVAELGARVAPDADITLSPKAKHTQFERVTILLNKPIGYVSGQPEDDHLPAVALITAENQFHPDGGLRFKPAHLKGLAPAGRLDIDSTGLLVMTQDGRVARTLIGDGSRVEKEYLVRVEGRMIEGGMDLLHEGLELDGKRLRPARVSWQNEDQLRFVLSEGRKRQIRRMCELVGLRVTGLKRIQIGRVLLGDLPLGQWRYLREDESFE